MGQKANAELNSRQRRRIEICDSLKRSNVIHTAYIFRSIMEVVILLLFIPTNFLLGQGATNNNLKYSLCALEIKDISLTGGGIIFFQCEGKKVSFFLNLLYKNWDIK